MTGADDRLAFRAARELDRRPALAVLVAPAEPGDARRPRSRCQGVRHAAQTPAGPCVSGPMPAGTSGSTGAATSDALEATMRRGRPPADLPASGRRRGPRRSAPDAERSSRRLEPTSRPSCAPCWPGTLAPDLSSTRLDFAFVAARHTGVGVLGASDATGQCLRELLRLLVASGGRLALETGGWQPPMTGPSVFYRPGAKEAALALAGDLGLAQVSYGRTTPRKTVVSATGTDTGNAEGPHPMSGAPSARTLSRPAKPESDEKQRTASDECGAGCHDRRHLTTGERKLTALFSRGLQTRQVVLKDSCQVPILLVERVVLDVRQSGADLRGRPMSVDRPVLCIRDDRVDDRLRNGSLRDNGEHQDKHRRAMAMAPKNLTLMSPPLENTSSSANRYLFASTARPRR